MASWCFHVWRPLPILLPYRNTILPLTSMPMEPVSLRCSRRENADQVSRHIMVVTTQLYQDYNILLNVMSVLAQGKETFDFMTLSRTSKHLKSVALLLQLFSWWVVHTHLFQNGAAVFWMLLTRILLHLPPSAYYSKLFRLLFLFSTLG